MFESCLQLTKNQEQTVVKILHKNVSITEPGNSSYVIEI